MAKLKMDLTKGHSSVIPFSGIFNLDKCLLLHFHIIWMLKPFYQYLLSPAVKKAGNKGFYRARGYYGSYGSKVPGIHIES